MEYKYTIFDWGLNHDIKLSDVMFKIIDGGVKGNIILDNEHKCVIVNADDMRNFTKAHKISLPFLKASLLK